MSLFKPNKIIVHHSATVDGQTFSTGAIRKYHIEVNGWAEIGYHCLTEFVKHSGIGYYENMLGRMWNIPGAHCADHNYDSLGICFVGNYDNEEPCDEILISGAKVIRLWMYLFGIPEQEIYPHRNFNPQKSCPGRLFSMDKLKELLR